MIQLDHEEAEGRGANKKSEFFDQLQDLNEFQTRSLWTEGKARSSGRSNPQHRGKPVRP